MAKRSKKRCEELPILHPHAAGIDVGASELFVAVSADRDPQPVRSFPTFTRDLNAPADWLEQCGIRSVAMESTSVYWIPVHLIFESRGLEVCLVNAQHVKNVPGRGELYRIFGVDLTNVPGISAITAQTRERGRFARRRIESTSRAARRRRSNGYRSILFHPRSTMARMSRFSKIWHRRSPLAGTATSTMARAKSSAGIT
jgi:transposase